MSKRRPRQPVEMKWKKAAGAAGVNIITPQFERTADMPSPGAPPEDIESLRDLDKRALQEMGCAPWDAPDASGHVLMLFPGEWYGKITAGTKIMSIMGREKVFVPGETPDDIRYGVLSFGFVVPA